MTDNTPKHTTGSTPNTPIHGGNHRVARPSHVGAHTPKTHASDTSTSHQKSWQKRRSGGGGMRNKRHMRGGKQQGHHQWTDTRQAAGGSAWNPAPARTVRKDIIPAIAPDTVRVIPLGGVEEIGKNMTAFETADDIFIIDMGFQFSEDTTPGVDYILPNTQYLEERKHKIRAVFITHGHLDHIGAIPYIMERIGNPPVYARNFTTLMIRKRQEEFPHLPPLNMNIVEKDQTITVGSMRITFFAVTHAIPDSMGIILETPYGDIVYTGDLRLDHTEGTPSAIEEEVYATFKDRKVLLLMTDSTNVENPGFSISEKVVYQNIEKVIANAPGRLILSTFASQVERMLKMLEICEQYGKKVVIEGRSMKTNIEVARTAGIIKTQPGTLIGVEAMNDYPENKVVALVTGAQGEEFAALMRIANKTHKHIKLTPRDTIVMSSSIVPGNERSVQKLKDNLSRQGAHIVHYRTSDIHSSGHANYDELAWIHKKIGAKFFIPIHGYHYMLRVHAELAKTLGTPPENVVIPNNGAIIEIQNAGANIKMIKETAPNNIIMVDGFSVGDMQEVVLRDRQTLAQDGMFVVVAVIDTATGKVRKSPDIISRGFVYLRESQDLLRQARFIAKNTIESAAGKTPINDFDDIKQKITDDLEKYLFQQTAKHPIVLPVLIGV